LLELGTELRQRGIGLRVNQLAHQRQSRRVAVRLAAASMGPRRNLPGGPPPPQQLLQARVADAEQGRQGPLRAAVLIVSTQNFLSEVKRIRFHA